MSYFIEAEQPYIFIHIPKTAGASIINSLEKYKITIIKNQRCKNQNYHSTIYDAIDQCNIKQYKKFSVVRNPYDRVISWYKFRIKCIRHDLKQYYKNNFRKGLILSSSYENLKEEYEDSQNFEKWISKYYNCAWDNTWFSIKNNQYEWIGDYMDIIIRFENLEEELQQKILPFKNIELLHSNKSSNQKLYKHWYTEESKKAVYKMYEKDLDFFKYTF